MAQSGPDKPAQSKATFPKKVRTTMEPDREYEVDEAEYTDLVRQGLIKGEK